MSKEVSRAQLERVVGQLFDEITKTQRGLASVQRAQDTKRTVLQPGESIQFVGEDGKPSMQIGGGTGVEYLDGPDPAQPETPEVEAGDGVVTVITDGYDVDANPAPDDLAHVLVHFSQDPGFEPYAGSRKGSIDHVAGAGQVGVSRHAGVWYVCVQWETLSGKLSEPSEFVEVDVAPPVDAEEIEADLEDARQRIKDAREYADEQFEAFDERVESAETDLNDAHDRIDAAEGALSTTQSDLDEAKADITAAQSAADQAVADALAAADLAEGKGQVITQVSAPTGSRARAENLWVRLPDMKVHYYDGDKWEPVLDPDTIAAAQQAANALTKANDLQTKHDALKLAVDGEGGLKDRLSTAENTLEDKAASSDLQELDDILRGSEDLPPQIADRFYAAMAIVEKLQAVSGWVGGVNLADNTVTAEKIEATREMITKIMGAEWAYISEQLVVEGDLIANNADIISAVIKNLDVTEQSNFVDAFAEQLRTKEFTALVATMARAIIAAPNLIPGMSNIVNEMPPPFDVSGFGRNTGHPSIWVRSGTGGDQGSNSVRTSDKPEALIQLEAGETYRFKAGGAATIPGTRYYIQLLNENNTSASGTTVDGRETTHLVSNQDAGASATSPIYVEAEFTVPKTAGYRLLFYANHANGAPNPGSYQWFHGLEIRSMQDGRLLIDGTVDTRHLNVTEEMVASFARILHLVVDQIDVNSLWADTTWQNAGHFGSEDGDQQTLVDGSGMIYYRKNNDNEFIPAITIGGGDFGINLFDENSDPIGGIGDEGDFSGRNFQAETYTLGGRPIFTDPEDYPGEGPILETYPKGEISYGYRSMNGASMNETHWGFLETQATEVQAGRTYQINISPFRMGDDRNYFMAFRYTLDGSSPNWNSTDLLTGMPQQGRTFSGSIRFTPEQSGTLRLLAFVYSGGRPLVFATSASTVHITVIDEGQSTQGIGMTRAATNTNPDDRPLVRKYHTGWPMGWSQNYQDGTPGYSHSNNLLQGIVAGTAEAASVWGGYRNRTATIGGASAEKGRTMAQALSGAEIHSGTVTLRGVATPARSHGYFRLHWHKHPSAPNSFPVTPPPENYFGFQIRAENGQEVRWDLPQDCLDAIADGSFGGFSLHARGATQPYFAARGGSGASGPILRLQYTR